jgi:hypothetical protein
MPLSQKHEGSEQAAARGLTDGVLGFILKKLGNNRHQLP